MANYDPFTLNNKQILITGASSGIGRSIAIACSKKGAKVVLTARNKSRLDETFSLLEGIGHQVISVDLSKHDEIPGFVEKLPQLDGVIHNAGVGSRVLCKSISICNLNEVFNINFNAPILLQAALLTNKKINKEASIVFISSKAAEMPSIGNAIYSASKGAINSYAKCLGLELAPRKIRVNCICPAMVWTDLIIQEGVSKEELELNQLKYPLKRFGEPTDISSLAIYLLSNASSWMTGSCIDITGGGEGTLT